MRKKRSSNPVMTLNPNSNPMIPPNMLIRSYHGTASCYVSIMINWKNMHIFNKLYHCMGPHSKYPGTCTLTIRFFDVSIFLRFSTFFPIFPHFSNFSRFFDCFFFDFPFLCDFSSFRLFFEFSSFRVFPIFHKCVRNLF